jgi:AcrR family transcriptional regulator
MPTRLTSAERRRVIEDAAVDLFSERGYAPTTVDDIVARAGVTKPMLYRHFDSKRHLATSLLERHRDELAAAPLDSLLALADRPFLERLDAMLDAWFGYVVEHPFVRLLLHDEGSDPAVSALVEELHARQRAADVALLREFAPQIPAGELETLGESIRSALAGLGLWVLDHPRDLASAKAAMRRVVVGVVSADPHGRRPPRMG